MIVTLIVIAALAVIGYFIYKHRVAVVAKAEADAKAFKTAAEADIKKVESKL
jgi:Tfp pilus assembly protein PilE